MVSIYPINRVVGTTGDDTLNGSNSDDSLLGMEGNDGLWGFGGNDVLDGGLGADGMFGGSGNDKYYVDNSGDAVFEPIGSSDSDTVFSSINYILPDRVEKLTLLGSSNLRAIGNALDNKLVGNAGNNIFDGRAGADEMSGGKGDDRYYLDSADDTVKENQDEGNDTVAFIYVATDYQLPDNVENGFIKGNGYGDGKISGNLLDNQLYGGDAGNTLDGGAGADLMKGNKGNDIYIVDNENDVASEAPNQGRDIIISTISYVLPANVEILQLQGNNEIEANGNNDNNTLIGAAGENVIAGAGGDDILVDIGGNDAMYGGTGNDTYVLKNEAGQPWAGYSQTVEFADAGHDRVETWATHTLAENIEALVLRGGANINGTGNAGDNEVYGNAGNNVLDGGDGNDILYDALLGESGDDTLLGGKGDDQLYGGGGLNTLSGGAGNDLYVLYMASNLLSENLNEGIDTVRSTLSYTLGNHLENLELMGEGDGFAIGNGLANQLTGNAGNNLLDGGDGSDTASYANAGVGVTVSLLTSGAQDTGGAGTDTLANIENLTGSAYADILTGDAKNNALAGGLGADTLTGGAGADRFRFATSLGGDNLDTVQDFATGQDSLRLDDAAFGAIGGLGQFAAGDERFFVGASAHDASDRIIYDPSTSALFYDADGNGAGGAVSFAILTGHPALAATDLWVI